MTPPCFAGRLAIVLSHPVQYYSPWFQWLRARTPLEFRVFYLWDFGVTARTDPQFGHPVRWDLDLLSGYDHEFVPNRARDPGTHHFRGLDNPTLPARLAAWRPDALLLFGYNWLAQLRALGWARRHGVPVLLRGDSHLLGRGRPGLARRLALGTLFRQFAACTTVGAANRDYYLAHGVPAGRLFPAPHSVNTARFDPQDPAARAAAARLRADLGLGDRRTVLFAGKFQPAKQPVPLLRAFLDVAGPDDALVFVGDGPERPALAALAATRPDRCVRLLPFANQTEMPARYLMADIFALPSRGAYETWGLAVNEAMHLGVPCLVSDVVGCQRDLVTPGPRTTEDRPQSKGHECRMPNAECQSPDSSLFAIRHSSFVIPDPHSALSPLATGWVFPAEDHAALAATLRTALRASAADLARLRANALARISGYTYEQTTAGLLAALAFSTLKNPPSSDTLAL